MLNEDNRAKAILWDGRQTQKPVAMVKSLLNPMITKIMFANLEGKSKGIKQPICLLSPYISPQIFHLCTLTFYHFMLF